MEGPQTNRTGTHVATGKVTTLEHEAGDDTVEYRALVTLFLRPLAKLAEVFGGPRNNIVKEVENDTAGLFYNWQEGISNGQLAIGQRVDND